MSIKIDAEKQKQIDKVINKFQKDVDKLKQKQIKVMCISIVYNQGFAIDEIEIDNFDKETMNLYMNELKQDIIENRIKQIDIEPTIEEKRRLASLKI